VRKITILTRSAEIPSFRETFHQQNALYIIRPPLGAEDVMELCCIRVSGLLAVCCGLLGANSVYSYTAPEKVEAGRDQDKIAELNSEAAGIIWNTAV
jgi:hypothetical protein